MRNKGPSRTADQSQAQARSSCTKCGNEVHANKDTCPATGRRCLKCGRLSPFARMCKGVVNDRKDKRANAVECEQQTNTHGSQKEEFLEDVYLYQLREGKSQNPTVAIHINGVPISLHLDTQAETTVVTEKNYESFGSTVPYSKPA